jgi:hypothetical protein
MMNPRKRNVSVLSAIALGGLLVIMLGLTGCSAEEEQPIVQERVAPPPPPPPPQPAVRPVDELKAELRIDDRVIFPEENAPSSTEERKAILSFFDAFARGDHAALARMLSDLDQRELERMVQSGQWDEATKGIDDILIHQTGNSPNGKVVVALLHVNGNDQAQLWYYTGQGDEFTFEAAVTPPNMASRLSGADWIAAWHRILQEEMELAMRSDRVVERRQQVLDEREDQDFGGSAPTGPPGPTMPAPGGPGQPGSPPPPRRIPRDRPPGG